MTLIQQESCTRCRLHPKHGMLGWCRKCLNGEASAEDFQRQYAGRAVCRIELVGEPRGKGRPRFTRAGIAYTPAKTRSYEAALQMAAQDAMAGRSPLTGPLTLTVEAHMPIPPSWSGKQQKLAASGARRPTGRPDFDNLLKPLDALNKVVWADDAQVVEVRCVKLYSERPRLVVTVEHAA